MASLVGFAFMMILLFVFAVFCISRDLTLIIIWFSAILLGIAGGIAAFWFMLDKDIGGFKVVLMPIDESTIQAQKSSLNKLGQEVFIKRNYDDAIKYFSLAEKEGELDEVSIMYKKQALKRLASSPAV